MSNKMTAPEIKKQIKALQKELDQVLAAPVMNAYDDEVIVIAEQIKALAKAKDVTPRFVAELVCRRLRTGFIYNKQELEVAEPAEPKAEKKPRAKKPAATK